ncbi:hypothetical protein AMJ57_00410 [Parcubacteria bacterium SG8_24]|nr:MAG: hypothetical protein AMJ57_00410 [Parcubacteria bacterium SG8_24]
MVYIPTGKELIDPFNILEQAGIREGMQVADFGCGTLGHYVFPAARMVGESGQVHAVDILKSVLGGIESRMKMEGAGNVRTVWGDLERDRGVGIDDGQLDIGLLINNLSLSKQKEQMLKECVRMVKGGGKFVIVDWKPTGAPFGPEASTRVSAEEAKSLAAGAGLKLEKEFKAGQFHYGLVFVR